MSRKHLMLVFGLIALPAYTFQNHLGLRAVQCLVSILFVVFEGGRIRYRTNIVVLLTIVIVHLLTPSGLVLFRLGSFPITLGALEVGIKKALLIIGLVYLSRLVVRSDLFSGGREDSLIGQVLKNFEGLTSRVRGTGSKMPRSLSGLVGWFDEILLAQSQLQPDTVALDVSTAPDTTAATDTTVSIDANVGTGAPVGTDANVDEDPPAKTPSALPVAWMLIYVLIQTACFAIGRAGFLPDFGDLF